MQFVNISTKSNCIGISKQLVELKWGEFQLENAIIIRKLQFADTEKLVEIWYNASVIAHSFISKEFWDLHKEELKNKYLPTAETWVAAQNGELLGFISLLGEYIGGLFVTPTKQRLGIGTKLLEQAKQVQRQLNVGVYSRNKGARQFYMKNGFTNVSEEVQPETGEIVIKMVLEKEYQ
jgi:putative acetyltransferase